jgi:hypothetical protein
MIDIFILNARLEEYSSSKLNENFSYYNHQQFLRNLEINITVRKITFDLNTYYLSIIYIASEYVVFLFN